MPVNVERTGFTFALRSTIAAESMVASTPEFCTFAAAATYPTSSLGRIIHDGLGETGSSAAPIKADRLPHPLRRLRRRRRVDGDVRRLAWVVRCCLLHALHPG